MAMVTYSEKEPDLDALHAALKAKFGARFVGVSGPRIRAHFTAELTAQEIIDVQVLVGRSISKGI